MNNIKLWAKGAIPAIILFFALIGVVGGTGNLIYFGQYFNAIGVLACGWLAIPEVKNYWNKIIGD